MSATKARRLAKALAAYTRGPKINSDGTYTIGNCDPDPTCASAAAMLCAQADEIEQLTQWKASATSVMPDFQAIAKALGVPLGESVQDKILPAILAHQSQCTWSLDDDPDRTAWQSACGQAWMFTEGGPAENNVRYCHGCGRPVHIVQPAEAPK